MEMDKIVNLDKEELVLQAHQSAEQIFRLRFQMKMGQLEGLKKLRELKKDIARIKTVQRQHELGIATHAHARVNATETEATPKKKAKKTKKSAAAKGSKKKAAKKTSTRNTKRTSKVASKAKSTGKTKVKAAKRGKANAKKGGS
ncbi:MAG TPA: 50S ribosomal protein L29 [Acidobacteriaceae bacterium]|nr:50S ribosomal protein L29 [Acidobacteriaceae bacterium]